MELQEFINRFAEQFDETDPAEITAETEYKELEEWSSLTALSIIAMADEEFNVILSSDELRTATTVEELFKIISSKIGKTDL